MRLSHALAGAALAVALPALPRLTAAQGVDPCVAGDPAVPVPAAGPFDFPGAAPGVYQRLYPARAATPEQPLAPTLALPLTANRAAVPAAWHAAVTQALAQEPTLVLVYDGAGGARPRCRVALERPAATPPAVAATPAPPPAPSAARGAFAPARAEDIRRFAKFVNPPDGFADGDCSAAVAEWRRQLGRTGRHEDRDPFTLLVFRASGTPCASNRDFGVQGSPILVGVLVDDPTQWQQVRATYDPCSLMPAAPNVLVNGKLSEITGTTSASRRLLLLTFEPRRCYNASLRAGFEGVATDAAAPRAVKGDVALQQYPRYRATIQLGVLNTQLQETQFGIRDSSGTRFVYDKGPANRGPTYVGTLVLYGLPHAVASIFSKDRSYEGREVIHETGLADRIGLALGTSLTSPTRRFFVGLTGEVLYGINVLGGWEAVAVPEPVGVGADSRFFGTGTEVPTRRRWRTSRLIGGVSVDLAYAARLLGSGR